MRSLPFTLLLLLAPCLLSAQPREGYYRFPTIHDETIVFVAEGDLWTVSAGGITQRLTTHLGEESYPVISPDGTQLAFSATYEGPAELYVMPSAGGTPIRLTYEGGSGRFAAKPVSWTPDNKILYRTLKYSTLPNIQLVAMDPVNGARNVVPLAQAADGMYEPGGRTLFFTRLPFQGSNAKRYQGGTAQNLWKFTTGDAEAVPLTADYPGTSKIPMWWNGRVYFATDRDGTMNIWSMDPDGGDLRQHTAHQGWDIRDPSLSDGRIVYQFGADIRIYDIANDEDRKVPITLASDFDQMREKWIQDPMTYLTAAHLSPDGDRVVLTSRGEVFVAPVEEGRFIHVTRKTGVRYRLARFAPDGNSLLALSDESGEVEWWKLPVTGIGPMEQLTADGTTLRHNGIASPDGTWLVQHDHNDELWLYNLETGAARKLAASPLGGLSVPSWSPDSRWLAYTLDAANTLVQIHLYNVEDQSTVTLTTDRYDSFSPAWHPDGQWIYFLSNRHFQSLVGSPWGSRQPDPFFDNQTKMYAIPLVEGVRSPFQLDDELTTATDEAEENDTTRQVLIAREGIQARLIEVPVPPGNYSDLTVNKGRLFWLSRKAGQSGGQQLQVLDIKPDAKPKTLVDDTRGYEMSLDGKKLGVLKNNGLYVIDAASGAPAKLDDNRLDLSGWTFPVDPREEWQQIFVDSWRLHRDYFYDRKMHGLDWPAVLEKYLPLVDRVTDRNELSDLQAQMISELSALHSSVRTGDDREGLDDVEPASLGAVLARDEAAGGYRVAHIYRSDPDIPDERSPPVRPGINVQEGDVILHINGVSTLSVPDPGALLRNQAGKQVRLRVRHADGAKRDVIVTAISQNREADLRYDEWEYTRRLMVEESSDNEIGYVHLRAMSRGNIAEWQREFYPVFNRQGLIIDVRHNRGGNIDSWILGKLLRRAWFYWKTRSGGSFWNMHYTFRGHMVVLANEWTASDGEAFAEGFKRLGLGKVIGTRTWGGEIWLSSSNVLVDQGVARAGETGVYADGEWLIEGHGVDPDIVVDNLPHATFNGEDSQLRAAVEYLQELIRQDPRPVPPAPPYPNLSVPVGQRP